MARLARLKFEDSGGWYHLYASVAARKGEYPLGDPVIRHKLLSLIKFYAHAYCLDVAAFALMGNHYHLVVRFEAPNG